MCTPASASVALGRCRRVPGAAHHGAAAALRGPAVAELPDRRRAAQQHRCCTDRKLLRLAGLLPLLEQDHLVPPRPRPGPALPRRDAANRLLRPRDLQGRSQPVADQHLQEVQPAAADDLPDRDDAAGAAPVLLGDRAAGGAEILRHRRVPGRRARRQHDPRGAHDRVRHLPVRARLPDHAGTHRQPAHPGDDHRLGGKRSRTRRSGR